jgi:hypothetical protein
MTMTSARPARDDLVDDLRLVAKEAGKVGKR